METPRVIENQGKSLGLLALSIAMIGSTYIVSRSWARVKLRPPDRQMEVTGSAKKRIVSDVIEWSATITTQDLVRVNAYKRLQDHVGKAQAFLRAQGVKDTEVRVSSVTTQEVYETVTEEVSYTRVERQIFKGHTMEQRIFVVSKDVPRIERVSREVTQLLEQGMTITSSSPSYIFTGLGALKIEMLAEATRDARTRAAKMVDAAGGGRLGKLRSVDMGVINVNPANSTETSWEGNSDTSSLEKDIITIVHVKYDLR